MNSGENILLLMSGLSQINDTEKIISLFIKGMDEIFAPARFLFSKDKDIPGGDVYEINSELNSYGYICIANSDSINYNYRDYLSKAIQILAIFMERIEFKGNSRYDVPSVNMDTAENFNQLKNTVEELKKAKNASLNLIEDLTEEIAKRTRYEKELKESEKNYRELIDGMNETIWVIGFDGSLIDFNRQAEKKLGYTRTELLSIGVEGIDISHDREVITALTSKMPIDKLQMFETTHISKTGKIIPVEIYSSLITYKGQKAILSIARDITQRKRDEEIQNILYEISRYSTSTKSIGDLLLFIKKQLGKVLDTSNFYVALYDSETQTLKKELFTNENYDYKEWDIENTRSGYVVKTGKSLLLSKDNKDQFTFKNLSLFKKNPPECWLGTPIIADNKVIGVIVVQSYTDPEAYNSNNVMLLEMVAHELAIVYQRGKMIWDLVIAKEQAEESDRLKTAFLANISHEIRTPMNGILGFLDLLKKPNLNDDQKEKFIEVVNKSSQRLLDTINNIVEISKIESGKLDINLSEVNIAKVMESHYEMFHKQAAEIGLKLNLSEKLIRKDINLLTDKHMFESILTKLLINALKFTKQGYIEFGNYIEDNFAVFFVKDTGIGISDDKQKLIFERFMQADHSITRPYEGAGLGLSIVKAYVELLGGKIWVESAIDKGSTFYFTIPYVPMVDNTETIKPIVMEEKKVHSGNIKILIAEDDEIAYLYFETLFENEPFTLIHTYNGEDAVKVMRENDDIALILMDIKMPGMNGLDATMEIRKFNTKIPIIAQTAHAFSGDKDRALEAGCSDYISKPINSVMLKDMIFKYIHMLDFNEERIS